MTWARNKNELQISVGKARVACELSVDG